MRRLWLCAGLVLALASVARAQTSADLTASNTSLTVGVASYATVAIQVSGTWTGTLNFQVGRPGGGAALQSVGCSSTAAGSTAANSTSANGTFLCPVGGFGIFGMTLTGGPTGTAHIEIGVVQAGGSGSGGGGGGSNAAAGATGSSVPASASYTAFNSGGTLVGASAANPFPTTCISGCAAAGDSTAASASISSGAGSLSTFPNGPTPYGLVLAGDNGAAFTVAGGGTLVATLTPQCSTDGGTTYPVNGYLVDPVTGVLSTSVSVSSPAQTVYQVLCPQGSSHASLKATAFTSGTSSFTGRATVVKSIAGLGVGAVSTSAPSYTTGTLGSFSLDLSGNLRTVTSIAANSSVNVNQFGGSAVVTGTGAGGSGIPRVTVSTDSNILATQSGNWTARVVGNAGAVLDAAGQNVAAPANALQIGGQFNTSPTTITNGNFSPLQLTSAARLIVDNSQVTQPTSLAALPSLVAGTAYVGKVATWADGTQVSGVTSNMTATTSTSVIAGVASNSLYITSCTIDNESKTVATAVLLQDGSGGTTLARLPAPIDATNGVTGATFTFPLPGLKTTSGNGLFAQNVTTASSTYVSCSGIKSTTSF